MKYFASTRFPLLLIFLSLLIPAICFSGNIGSGNKIDKELNSPDWWNVNHVIFEKNDSDTLPNYKYQIPVLDTVFNFAHFASLGDVNGDGFDDIGVVATTARRGSSIYGNKLMLVYYGGSLGLNHTPDKMINLDLTLYFIGTLNGIGDVNGDGYDDVYFSEVIFFGSDTGLSHNYGWKLFRDPDNRSRDVYYNSMDGKAFPAGDVNNDGYDDFMAPASDMGRLYIFLGGTPVINTPSADQWMGLDDFTALLGASAGDINGDGYDDILFHGHEDAADAMIYMGSSGTIDPQPSWLHNTNRDFKIDRSIATADVNGDGFNDITVYVILEQSAGVLETQFTIYGSSTGPDLLNADTLFKRYIDYQGEMKRLNSIGDINRDGFEDIHITPLPTNYDPNIREDPYVLFGNSAGLVNEPGYYYKEFHHMSPAGDINGDGYPDFSAQTAENSAFVIIYSKPPVTEVPVSISCQPEIKFCYDSSGQYSISPLEIIGNTESVNYKITGATKRTGTGNDASGIFKWGVNTIIWTVTLPDDKILTCTTVVQISRPISVNIKPGIAVTEGGEPGVIYIGYGSDGFRLAALPSGGSGPYTYLWSNGGTEKYNRIKHTRTGEFTYTLELTNKDGCKAFAETIIEVRNVRCTSPLEELFSKLFPTLYNDPAILKLFHSSAEIQVCVNGRNTCVAKTKVAGLLSHGASLGNCLTDKQSVSVSIRKPFEVAQQNTFDVQVYPNPSRTGFRLNLKGNNSPVSIRISDLNGRQIQRLNNLTGNVVELGADLQPGIYVAEIMNGKERKVVKLVKLK